MIFLSFEYWDIEDSGTFHGSDVTEMCRWSPYHLILFINGRTMLWISAKTVEWTSATSSSLYFCTSSNNIKSISLWIGNGLRYWCWRDRLSRTSLQFREPSVDEWRYWNAPKCMRITSVARVYLILSVKLLKSKYIKELVTWLSKTSSDFLQCQIAGASFPMCFVRRLPEH